MDAKRSSDIAAALLAWYDAHRRDLPWRAKPGATADPYRVWLSEVMLQQTTVATVRPRFAAWVARWPTFADLAAADEDEVMAAWAGLGYYARARNLLAAARVIAAEHGGAMPRTEAALRTLPGLGDYTAAAIAAIAFGEKAAVVDTNVVRVVARLDALEDRRGVRPAAERLTPDERAGDFAQAMMDLGATICTPRGPRCLLCPIRAACRGYASGEPERFPAKAAKKAKPKRYGTIFWLEHGTPAPSVRPSTSSGQTGVGESLAIPVRTEPVEALSLSPRQKKGSPSTSSGQTAGRSIFLVRRPAKGLLGGMRALPTGPWADERPGLADAPVAADWRLLDATVTHGFTHFDLELALAVAITDAHSAPPGEWWPVDDLASAGLPTVFAKAADAIRRMR